MISVEIELNYSCYHVAPFDLSNLSTWEDLQFWQDQLASNKIQTSGILLWSWVWPRANPRCPIYNILSHDIIWYRTWVVLCPSFHIMSERTCRWRSNWTYSATASDHPMGTINAQVHKKRYPIPSPRPAASTVWRQSAVPPPVILFVIPCVFSWTTISFSSAPSRIGYRCWDDSALASLQWKWNHLNIIP